MYTERNSKEIQETKRGSFDCRINTCGTCRDKEVREEISYNSQKWQLDHQNDMATHSFIFVDKELSTDKKRRIGLQNTGCLGMETPGHILEYIIKTNDPPSQNI